MQITSIFSMVSARIDKCCPKGKKYTFIAPPGNGEWITKIILFTFKSAIKFGIISLVPQIY